MIVHIERSKVEVVVVQHYQYLFIIIEFTKECAMLIVIQAINVWVIPNFKSTESRMTAIFKADSMNRFLRE